MPPNSHAFEREEDLLLQMFNDGRLSQAEYNAEMRELQRDYAAAAEEAAWAAYQNEKDQW